MEVRGNCPEEVAMMLLRHGTGLVAGLALLLPVLLAPPASAAGLRPGGYYQEPEAWSDEGTYDPECRGLDLAVRFRASGVTSIRRVLGSGNQAFFQRDRYRFREVWTDEATGAVVMKAKGSYVFKEVEARRVARSAVPERFVPQRGIKGPVFEFKSRETGSDVVMDADGRVLYLTGGMVVFKNLFDTRGDHKPGGVSLHFRVTRVVGPHPLGDIDICDVAAAQMAA